jgi:tetratricopeptide (TPR) repeat protein
MKKEKVNIFGHDIDKEKLLIGAAVGGVVLAGLGLYFLSGSSSSKKKKSTTSGKSVPPSSRLLVVFNNRFEDLNSCPGEDLNNLFVTSDSETLKLYPKLKAGAQLIKLNNEKVAGLSFKEILQKISTAAIPITTQFLENPELEKAWKEAEDLKIKANEMNKQKSDPDRYQKALDLYSQAIKLHPTRKEYYGNRVLMYFGQKDFQKALSDCEQFKPFDPHGRWLRAKVIACCFDASVAAGFDLAARGRFLPCMSTPVPNWGKLQAHGSLPTGGRMYLAELIFELSVDYIVLFDPS